jgi:hypothetical protein
MPNDVVFEGIGGHVAENHSPVIPLTAAAGEARTLAFPRDCTEEVRAALPRRAPKRAEDILFKSKN